VPTRFFCPCRTMSFPRRRESSSSSHLSARTRRSSIVDCRSPQFCTLHLEFWVGHRVPSWLPLLPCCPFALQFCTLSFEFQVGHGICAIRVIGGCFLPVSGRWSLVAGTLLACLPCCLFALLSSCFGFRYSDSDLPRRARRLLAVARSFVVVARSFVLAARTSRPPLLSRCSARSRFCDIFAFLCLIFDFALPPTCCVSAKRKGGVSRETPPARPRQGHLAALNLKTA